MFETALVVTTLLCSLVAGLLFAFAVVAMPGIGALGNQQFLKAFQVMDGVIQRNQPWFMVAWLGSVIGVVGTTAVGLGRLDGLELGLLVGAAIAYLVGVQLPTIAINIPLNNRLQLVDVAAVGEETLATERKAFEARWNRWNRIRTAMAVLTTASLLVVLLRL